MAEAMESMVTILSKVQHNPVKWEPARDNFDVVFDIQ